MSFDPIDNGYLQRDTWMYVDTTEPGAIWEHTQGGCGNETVDRRWDAILEITAGEVFNEGLQFVQDRPGTFSAIDGVTIRTVEWETVTDFELATSSGRPLLDGCKNGGWKTHPRLPFRSRGAARSSRRGDRGRWPRQLDDGGEVLGTMRHARE